jgi:hypothetical protein
MKQVAKSWLFPIDFSGTDAANVFFPIEIMLY